MADDLAPADDFHAIGSHLPELDELFEDESIDLTEPPSPILDADRIDRTFAALHRAEQAASDFQQLAERRRADLEARIARQGRPLAEKVGWLRRSLELSAAALHADDPKRTRMVFPNGTLASKAGGTEWEWTDEAAALAWARVHCHDAVVYPDPPRPRVDKNILKAAAKPKTLKVGPDKSQVPAHEDGSVVIESEIVPGVTVKARPRTFTPEVSL